MTVLLQKERLRSDKLMLTYEDMVQLFPSNKKLIHPAIQFHTVSTFACFPQGKGLFIPLHHDSGELEEAISNGAIGMLWEKNKALPHYMPNHFFVFYSNDLWKGLENMLDKYHENVISNGEENYTQFVLENNTKINKIKQPSDITSLIERVEKMQMELNNEGRDQNC
jgi:hypothetical protein